MTPPRTKTLPQNPRNPLHPNQIRGFRACTLSQPLSAHWHQPIDSAPLSSGAQPFAEVEILSSRAFVPLPFSSMSLPRLRFDPLPIGEPFPTVIAYYVDTRMRRLPVSSPLQMAEFSPTRRPADSGRGHCGAESFSIPSNRGALSNLVTFAH